MLLRVVVVIGIAMVKWKKQAQPNLARNLFLQVLSSTVWAKSGAKS
jgi:hypothetical protein